MTNIRKGFLIIWYGKSEWKIKLSNKIGMNGSPVFAVFFLVQKQIKICRHRSVNVFVVCQYLLGARLLIRRQRRQGNYWELIIRICLSVTANQCLALSIDSALSAKEQFHPLFVHKQFNEIFWCRFKQNFWSIFILI